MSEANSVREMWDNSRKEMKELSIKRLESQIAEIAKYHDNEDYNNFLGYVSCLFDVNVFDLREAAEFRERAKAAMGYASESVINKAASALGKKGGLAKTETKASTSRENGKRGGRPKKAKSE